jgi:hypothetical protein
MTKTSKKSTVPKNFQNHFRITFDRRYFMNTINVIALKFPSILWPAIKSMTAIGKRIRQRIENNIRTSPIKIVNNKQCESCNIKAQSH